MDLNIICQQVIDLTKKVGSFIKDEAAVFDRSKVKYKGFNDPVTWVDKEAEIRLIKGLQQILPKAGFIAEEGTQGSNSGSGSNEDSTQFNWIVDPLDGTTNFTHSVPVFAISIALQQNSPPETEKRGIGETERRKTKRFTDSPIHPFTDSVRNSGVGDLGAAAEVLLGVVYEINRDECFHAYKNGGAFRNNKKITISDTAQLSESLLATGFPYADFEKMPEYLEILKTFMQNSHGLRRMGSASVDLAYVACGIFEGFFEYSLHAWDVAAGALIVEEAGGTVTDFGGGNDFLFGKEIIAAGKIHQEMLEVIGKNWKKL